MDESLRQAVTAVGGGHGGTDGVESPGAPGRHAVLDGIEPPRYRPQLVGHRPLSEVVQRAGGPISASRNGQAMQMADHRAEPQDPEGRTLCLGGLPDELGHQHGLTFVAAECATGDGPLSREADLLQIAKHGQISPGGRERPGRGEQPRHQRRALVAPIDPEHAHVEPSHPRDSDPAGLLQMPGQRIGALALKHPLQDRLERRPRRHGHTRMLDRPARRSRTGSRRRSGRTGWPPIDGAGIQAVP